jgi:hypothetical protein
MQNAETVLDVLLTGEPDDQETVTSDSEGGHAEKDQPPGWHLAARPTLRRGCAARTNELDVAGGDGARIR